MPHKKRLAAVSPRLKNAKPENYFILVTGVPLKSIKELATSMDTMNDWVFRHHVNDSRNDFANWIKDIFEEADLANDIQSVRDIGEMRCKILKYLVNKYL